MKTILKIYIVVTSILWLDYLAPTQVYAWSHGLAPVNNNSYACGPLNTNTWCVDTDGWTKFSGTPNGAGTACSNSSSTTTATCVVAATNTVAASFTASRATNQLSIVSGTPPAIGQTVVRTDGSVLGTILSGSNPTFTVSTSGTIVAEAMTSSIGNDTTCASQAMPVGLTSATLSSFTPTLPCFSASRLQVLMRDNSADWAVLKKGDSWCGGWSGPAGGAFTKNGKNTAEPALFTAYGVGARPKFKTCGQNVTCAEAAGGRAKYMAMVGIECYAEYMDPDSPDFLGVTVSATTTSGSAVLTGVTNISGDYANLATSFWAYGSGIVANKVVSINTGASTITLTTNASFTSSGPTQIQFAKQNNTTNMSFITTLKLFILEDCYTNFSTFTFQGFPPQTGTDTNIRVRRNVVADSYVQRNTGPGGGGSPFTTDMYGAEYVFEENLSYHVGWNDRVWAGSGSNQVHSWYLHDPNYGVTFIRNITAGGSANSGQIRNGGEFYDNLFVNNPIGLNQAPFGFNMRGGGGSVSYNTVTGSGETSTALRIASAATAIGNAVLHMPGVLNGAVTFAGKSIDDLDNPGAITGGVSTLGADTVTMTSNVVAGQRGNGVQIGDRIQVTVYGGQGDNTRASGAMSPSVDPASPGVTTFPIGTSTFFIHPSFPIPAWVTAGMTIQEFNDQVNGGFPGGDTTIASIAGDRLSLTTTDASTTAIVAFQSGGNAFFNIFTPSTDVSTYWPTNVLTQNIYSNNISKANGVSQFAINLTPGTQGASITNNYYYNWNHDPTVNILDSSGWPGQNVLTPQLRNCGGTGGLTCSNDKPNLYVEAYEATLNTNNITASILANGSGGTILRVTAGTVSIGLRVFGTGVIPALILSDLGGGDWLIDNAQVVSSRAMYTGSLVNFYNCARLQSKDNWNPACTAHAVNEYFRAQVGIASQPVTYH